MFQVLQAIEFRMILNKVIGGGRVKIFRPSPYFFQKISCDCQLHIPQKRKVVFDNTHTTSYVTIELSERGLAEWTSSKASTNQPCISTICMTSQLL